MPPTLRGPSLSLKRFCPVRATHQDQETETAPPSHLKRPRPANRDANDRSEPISIRECISAVKVLVYAVNRSVSFMHRQRLLPRRRLATCWRASQKNRRQHRPRKPPGKNFTLHASSLGNAGVCSGSPASPGTLYPDLNPACWLVIDEQAENPAGGGPMSLGVRRYCDSGAHALHLHASIDAVLLPRVRRWSLQITLGLTRPVGPGPLTRNWQRAEHRYLNRLRRYRTSDVSVQRR